MSTHNTNELQHHGVKGMKWGVRKDRIKTGGKSAGSKPKGEEQGSSVKEKAARVAKKGAKKTAKILAKTGKMYVADQVIFGGTGTELAKSAVKNTGRAAVTAYTMARGGYDIRWYDN